MTQKLGTLDDRALWERACRGEDDAWTALQDRFGPALTALLLGQTAPESVPGAVEGIYARARGELRTIPNPSAVGAWLLDRARARPGKGKGSAEGDVGRMLQRVKKLDADAKEAVLLEAAAGLDDDGIAILLGLRLPEVRDRLARGHEQVEPAALASALAPYRYRPRPKPRKLRPLVLSFVIAAIAVAAFFIVTNLPESKEGWRVAWVSGAKGADHLAVGDRIETVDDQRARVSVDDVGHIDIEPQTLLLREAGHRDVEEVRLERGALQVQVAPSGARALAVTTPSARVVASRAELLIECTSDGRGVVTVPEGKATIGADGGFVVSLPQGASCRLLPESGPGVPYFADGPEALRGVTPDAALSAALVATQPRDTLALWHLVPRVEADVRELVVARIAEIVPPPEGSAIDAILALDSKALAAWAGVLEAGW